MLNFSIHILNSFSHSNFGQTLDKITLIIKDNKRGENMYYIYCIILQYHIFEQCKTLKCHDNKDTKTHFI